LQRNEQEAAKTDDQRRKEVLNVELAKKNAQGKTVVDVRKDIPR